MQAFSMRAFLGVLTAFLGFLMGPDIAGVIGNSAVAVIMIAGTVLAAASPQLIAIVDEHERVGYTAIISLIAAVVAALSHADVIGLLPESMQHIVMLMAPILAALAPKMLGMKAGAPK